MWFAAQLAKDGFGDIVVAAPVGGALGQPELVQMAGTIGGVLGGVGMDLACIFHQITLPAQRLHRLDFLRRSAGRHHCDKGQPQQARKPRFGNRSTAGGGIHHGLPRMQAAIAQRVQVQRTCQAVLQAAGGVGGFVLEIKRNVGETRKIQPQQVGVGRARGFLLQQGQGIAHPVPGGGSMIE